ncbi:ParA family protein [Methylophaga thalassica]|uniref:ParA family protein n=1 Tax=Methylophaga thalassica TaxID=40223 RepID=UPI00361AF2A2
MAVWAVCNQKGGVAKTTTVVSLASLLAQKGEPVLMLDLDPHGSLTTYLGYDPDSIETSIYTLFQQLDNTPKEAILKSLKKLVTIIFSYYPPPPRWQHWTDS